MTKKDCDNLIFLNTIGTKIVYCLFIQSIFWQKFSVVQIIVDQQIWLKEFFYKKNSIKKINSKIPFTWKNASLEIGLTENSGIAYVIIECSLL